MEREGKPDPSELITNEELNPRHFYAVYEFENAEVCEPQVTQIVHKAWEMGFPVRYWWLSEVADLGENPDRLIIGVHHPSQAEDAGLDLYTALVEEYGVSWDLWDGVDAREYIAFGLPVEEIATINKPDETPLFPELQPVIIEWRATDRGVEVKLRLNQENLTGLPINVQEQVEQVLVNAIGICTAVMDNQDVVEKAGGDMAATLASIAEFMKTVRDFYETRWQNLSNSLDEAGFPFD